MAFQRYYADNRLGLIDKWTGTFSGQETLAHIKSILSSEDSYLRLKYILIDFTGVDRALMTNEESESIVTLSLQSSKINPDLVIAFVSHGDLMFGIARMLVSLSYESPWDPKVFRSRRDAEAWIERKVKVKFDIDLTFA